MTSSWKKAMTWGTLAAAVASALLVITSGAGWPERLAHDGRGVMRQLDFAPRGLGTDPSTAVPVREQPSRRSQP